MQSVILENLTKLRNVYLFLGSVGGLVYIAQTIAVVLICYD